MPHNNLCYEAHIVQANYIAGTPYVGENVRMYPGRGGSRGEFSAWDPVAAKTMWSVKETSPAWSGKQWNDWRVGFSEQDESRFAVSDAFNE